MRAKLAYARPALVTLVAGSIVAAVMAANGQTTRPTTRPVVPPSAEQILQDVLEDRSQGQPLLPTEPGLPVRPTVDSEGAADLAQPAQPLLHEGDYLRQRGRLVRDGNWWTLVPEGVGQSAAPSQPIRLLPNRMLELMEQWSVGGTRPMLFTVSGQVTTYRSANYLLVVNAMVEQEQGNLSK